MVLMPELESERCDGCQLCVAVCHCRAIVSEEGNVRIRETESCDFCGACEAVCPRSAIWCHYIVVASRD